MDELLRKELAATGVVVQLDWTAVTELYDRLAHPTDPLLTQKWFCVEFEYIAMMDRIESFHSTDCHIKVDAWVSELSDQICGLREQLEAALDDEAVRFRLIKYELGGDCVERLRGVLQEAECQLDETAALSDHEKSGPGSPPKAQRDRTLRRLMDLYEHATGKEVPKRPRGGPFVRYLQDALDFLEPSRRQIDVNELVRRFHDKRRKWRANWLSMCTRRDASSIASSPRRPRPTRAIVGAIPSYVMVVKCPSGETIRQGVPLPYGHELGLPSGYELVSLWEDTD